MSKISIILIISTLLIFSAAGEIDYDTYSVCHNWSYGRTQDNVAYMCNHQALGSCHLRQAAFDDGYSAFAEYGFGGFGYDQQSSCCRCFQVQLQDQFAPDKDLIVQGINTGTDAVHGQIDLSMIAGGFGLNNGCADKVFAYTGQQWDGMAGPAQYSNSKAGDWCSDPSADNSTCQNIYAGGIRMRADCQKLPTQELRDLCDYSFETRWRSESIGMRNTLMKEIRCPAGLRRLSGCDKDDPTLPDPVGRLSASDPNVRTGIMTTMWDCCKVSCAWKGNVVGANGSAVMSCDNNGNIKGLGTKMPCQSIQCDNSCRSCKVANDPTKCTSCNDGSFLSNGSCLSCTASLNCQTCSDSAKCLTCLAGYNLQADGSCRLPCHPTCNTCSIPANNSSCTSCFNGSYLSSQNQCLPCPNSMNCTSCINQNQCSVCKPGYDIQADQTCKPGCDVSCKTCSAPLDSNQCSSCFDGSYLNGSTCVKCPTNCASCTSATSCSVCINNTVSINGICTACDSQCGTCQNTTSFCLSCTNTHTVAINGVCIPCTSPCSTCTNTPTTCTACVAGYDFDGTTCKQAQNTGNCDPSCLTCYRPLDSNACSTCPVGHLILNQGNCQPCQPQCQTCDGGNPNFCTSCPTGFILQGNTCVGDNQDQTKCHPNCVTCSYINDPNHCTSCHDGFILLGSGSCQPCQPQCKTCGGGSPIFCTSCPDNFTLSGNTCVPSNQNIGSCHPSCKTCNLPNNNNACTSCFDGFINLGGGCQQCQPQCKTCQGNPSQCIECAVGFGMRNNWCYRLWPDSTACYSTCSTCEQPGNPYACVSCPQGSVITSQNTCAKV